jgi:REP element-mobilizing transposase RayT
MTLYKNKYRVESARLPGWDYSRPGYYFITVCTHHRGYLFGNIKNGKMFPNEYGNIILDEWDRSFTIRRELIRDEFVVMPNHFHGIVRLVDQTINSNPIDGVRTVEMSGRTSLHRPAQNHENNFKQNPNRIPQQTTNTHPKKQTPRLRPYSVSSFMAGVKSVLTRRINIIRKTPGARALQYRFHDHVIRDENELFRIRQYIRNNPFNWEIDKFHAQYNNCVREEIPGYGQEPWMV